jgi:4-amino-4-deoxy-L-arabinose transferase-like glycosyltransferase
MITGSDRRFRLATAALLLLALAGRVAYVLHTGSYVPAHDDLAYDRLARHIAWSGAYPDVNGRATAYRPPGYSYVLGTIYAVTGPGHARILTARLFQAALGTALVGLLGVLAYRLFGRRAAFVTMLLAAVYIPLIAVGAALLSEPQAALLEVVAVLAVLRWREAGTLRWAVAAGVVAGALTLTRTNAFVVLAALVAGIATAWARPRRVRLKASLALLATALAVVAPWTVRNAVVMRAFIPVSDEAGGTLAGTYNPVSAHDRAAPGYWHLLSQIPQYVAQTAHLANGPEAPFQARLQDLAVSYAVHHPAYVGTVALWNTLRVFDFTGLGLARYDASLAGISSSAVSDACVVAVWAVLALALLAVASRRVRRAVPGFVWAVPALVLATVVLVNGEAPRLRIPVDPFLLILAGAGLARFLEMRRRPVDVGADRGHTAVDGGGAHEISTAGRRPGPGTVPEGHLAS